MLKIHVCMFPHTCTHSGQPCPPFKIIILDEADSMTNTAQVSKTKHSKRRNHFVCLYCRLPCVVQWRRNQKQLVSASYATTSAGQTKPFRFVMVISPCLQNICPKHTLITPQDENTPLIRTLLVPRCPDSTKFLYWLCFTAG